MTTTLRRLTNSERAAFARTRSAVVRCQKQVSVGEVQCDRCDHAAETVSVSHGAIDCLCRGCYPRYIADEMAAARRAAIWF